jgi:hypothetical protein
LCQAMKSPTFAVPIQCGRAFPLFPIRKIFGESILRGSGKAEQHRGHLFERKD